MRKVKGVREMQDVAKAVTYILLPPENTAAVSRVLKSVPNNQDINTLPTGWPFN
jgi:hypothetical protein